MSKEVTSPTIPKCSNGRPEKIPHPSKALAGKGRVYIRVVCFAKSTKLRSYKTTKDEEMRGRKWHASSRFGPVTCENPSFAIKDQ
jgi:hypothetical protein